MKLDVTRKCISHYGKSVYQKYEKDRLSLVDAYKKIKSEDYKYETMYLRSIADKNKAREYKFKNFEHARFSGVFYFNSDDGLKYHSGYMVIDLDHLDRDLREVALLLVSDRRFHTLLLFLSPSGHGLKWVIEIDLTKGGHKGCFMAVSQYLKETYGLVADPSGINVSRTCFLPYDPECYACEEIINNL